MPRRPALLGLLAVLCAVTVTPAEAGDFLARQRKFTRVKDAAERRMPVVEAMFADAGAAWPPRGAFIRAFKLEEVVELWAAPARAGDPHVLVRTFPICANSGQLGPKRRQGDYQVPEGFYRVSVFNPQSSYHLSLGVSYPNAADRFYSKGHDPGSAIMIHGDCVTIGCIPLRDVPIEDLYLAASAARDAGQQEIPIHIFPCRLDTPQCQLVLDAQAESRPELAAFWDGLVPGYLAFIEAGAPPTVRAKSDGTYQLVPPGLRRPLVTASSD